MGLYDNYKLSNSTYISQYVGSIVPELKEFSQVMQKRYNDARDTDDALVEAMGNLQHLDTDEDTTYANELKQTYLNRLMERSGRDDYENMGRRTQRDARAFSSDYTPLVNRLKGMQAITERVLQDDKIFSPETKQKILGKIKKDNSAAKDPVTGDFVRDASGKIQLGAIQDWAYAKDVDINKKLADFLKMKETDISQSGYRPDGRGLMISGKAETRSPQEIAIMAKEMMETDPEIRAMVERDVELNTYQYTPAQISEMANKGNVSIYDKLKKQGLSESQIKANLKANGLSTEIAQLKPVDTLRQEYINRGLNPQDADAAYVKNQVRRSLTDPHIELVANLLKVDRRTIEAREDPEFAARATAAAMAALMPDKSGDAMPLTITPDNAINNIDIVNLQNTAVETAKASDNVKGSLQAAIGSYLGLPKPTGATTANWYNTTGRYLNDKAKQGELIQQLQRQGKSQEANNLTQAFQQYNALNQRAVYARQNLDNIVRNVDVTPAYEEYKKLPGDKKMTKAQFQEALLKNPIEAGGGTFNRQGETFMDKLMQREDFAFKVARGNYFKTVQAKAQEFGKSTQTGVTVFEPTTAGYPKEQTAAIENGLISGTVKGRDMATGESVQDILRKELGKGWFSSSISAKDMADPNSDYNKALKMFQARIAMDSRGAGGEPVAIIKTPGGQTRQIVLDNVSPNLPTEMAVRIIGAAGKYMTWGEATQHMQAAAQGVGYSQLKNVNQVDLYNLRPAAKPYQLNDIYYLKVAEAGVKGMGSTNVYTLMVKQGDKYIPTRVMNKTQLGDIIQAIGQDGIHEQSSVTPKFNYLGN